MGKLILISDDDLKSLIREAVANAVDNVTKKIASKAAVMSYNNQIFNPVRRRVVESSYGGGCGSTGGGCGSVSTSRSYSSCGGGGGGCGSTSSYSNSGGGCGGGNTSGGC